jgi:hypothetical protein
MPSFHYWFGGAASSAFFAFVTAVIAFVGAGYGYRAGITKADIAARRIALVTAVISVMGVGYSWYRAAITEMESASSKADAAAQKAGTERIKDLLGKALSSANLLQLPQKGDDEAKKDAEAWGQRTCDLIAAAYGDGEAVLFLDDSGYVFYSENSKKK